LSDASKEPLSGAKLYANVGICHEITREAACLLFERVWRTCEIGVVVLDLDEHSSNARAVVVEVEDKARKEPAIEVAVIEFEAGKAVGDAALRARRRRVACDYCARARGEVAREYLELRWIDGLHVDGTFGAKSHGSASSASS